jgi:hypothetical protein
VRQNLEVMRISDNDRNYSIQKVIHCTQ